MYPKHSHGLLVWGLVACGVCVVGRECTCVCQNMGVHVVFGHQGIMVRVGVRTQDDCRRGQVRACSGQ